MNFTDIIEEVCQDLTTKEEVIKRLHDFGFIDVRGVKYLLIHKYYMERLFEGCKIMESMHKTAIHFNISISQVENIRRYWRQRKRRTCLEIEA